MQQIFEYMFMIFFFIYIVTTLQKLYHSFTGVERQELRNNQRDIQIDRTSFSNESQPDYYSSWTGWAGYKNTGFTYTQEDNKNYSSQNGFIKETEHGIIKEFHGDKLLNDNLENIKVVHYVSKNKNSGGND